jgi:hypothetical protein
MWKQVAAITVASFVIIVILGPAIISIMINLS